MSQEQLIKPSEDFLGVVNHYIIAIDMIKKEIANNKSISEEEKKSFSNILEISNQNGIKLSTQFLQLLNSILVRLNELEAQLAEKNLPVDEEKLEPSK